MDLSIDRLNAKIQDVSNELTKLTTREQELQKPTTDVDLVERNNLLRRLWAERRNLNKKLADFSVQKSLRENIPNYESDSDESEESEAEGEDDQEMHHRLHLQSHQWIIRHWPQKKPMNIIDWEIY